MLTPLAQLRARLARHAARSPLVEALEGALGREHVLSAPEDLAGYEYDATIERARPDAVAFPASSEEVSAVVRIAREHDVPVVPRGSGTGLAGGALAVQGGVLCVMTRMNRILEIDARNRLAVVEPGVINLHLQDAVAPLGLTYAPDPSSQRVCSLGGNVATNSGGPHTLVYGSTVNHVLGVEVVLADGRVTFLGSRVPDAPGIDLRGLFVGSEGTLGVATEIVVRLVRMPEAVRTMLGVFDGVEAASEAVSAVIRRGVIPVAMEMLDRPIIEAVQHQKDVGYPSDAGAVLLLEVEGLRESVEQDASAVIEALEASGARGIRVADSDEERAALWEGRKSAIGAIGAVAPNFYLLDGVVPRTRLPEVMRGVVELSERYGFRCGNVFHAGDGNLHPNIMFDELVPGASARVLELGGEIMRLCVDAGGSITGEHGIGLEKRSYMEWVFSLADLEAMRRVRVAFGGDELFNPCKILPTGRGCGQAHAAEIRHHLQTPGVYV
jgi:glycolate oxidase